MPRGPSICCVCDGNVPRLDTESVNTRRPHLDFSTASEEPNASADLLSISVNTSSTTKVLKAGQASELKRIEASPRTLTKAARAALVASLGPSGEACP